MRDLGIAISPPEWTTPSERIATLLPSFGGAFIKDGTLHVHLAGNPLPHEANTAVSRVLHDIGRANLPVRFLESRYSFRELSTWRERLAPALGALGVTFSEVGERENKIRLGIANSADVQAVEGALDRARVPRGAVEIVVAPPPIQLATLDDRIRPLVGGTLIRTGIEGRSRNLGCTYGVNVRYDGRRHMVMNSHCTWSDDGQYRAGWIGARIFQNHIPTFESDANTFEVGLEVQDPAFRKDLPYCQYNNDAAAVGCRYSDAALVELDNLSDNPNSTWDLGGIARPVAPAVYPDTIGSITIDSNGPAFQISHVSSDIFVGDVANKVGRETGWTQGEVISTCRDVYTRYYGYLCQGVVRGGAGSGDSGSPVFWLSSAGEYLMFGILWGKRNPQVENPGPIEYYFSKWQGVDRELGTILNDLDPSNVVEINPSIGDCTTDPSLPC